MQFLSNPSLDTPPSTGPMESGDLTLDGFEARAMVRIISHALSSKLGQFSNRGSTVTCRKKEIENRKQKRRYKIFCHCFYTSYTA